MRGTKAQTVAVVNKHVRPVIQSVLAEVLSGVTRERRADNAYTVNFRLKGGLVVEVMGSRGEHYGTWAIQLRAL